MHLSYKMIAESQPVLWGETLTSVQLRQGKLVTEVSRARTAEELQGFLASHISGTLHCHNSQHATACWLLWLIVWGGYTI